MSARSHRDARGRPRVAVTGIGVVSSLGQGQAETWAAMIAGRSGIHAIDRFSTEGLRTRIAGTVDFLDTEPLVAPLLSERFAAVAAEEAVAQAGLGAKGDFPGRCSSRSRPSRWNGRSGRPWPRPRGATDRSITPGCSGPLPRGGSIRGTTSSSSAPWRTVSPTGSARGARPSRSPPPARRAPPRSSSASRRSGAARPRRRSASARTAR